MPTTICAPQSAGCGPLTAPEPAATPEPAAEARNPRIAGRVWLSGNVLVGEQKRVCRDAREDPRTAQRVARRGLLAGGTLLPHAQSQSVH